ncbi:MAG: hypothetical protein ACT4PZ_06950 [Panacagrimonas sp.]
MTSFKFERYPDALFVSAFGLQASFAYLERDGYPLFAPTDGWPESGSRWSLRKVRGELFGMAGRLAFVIDRGDAHVAAARREAAMSVENLEPLASSTA